MNQYANTLRRGLLNNNIYFIIIKFIICIYLLLQLNLLLIFIIIKVTGFL